MATLLVVDDSEIDRRLVEGLLKANTDWRIQTAADGASALARVAQTPIDVVITDLQMPEMDGLELVKQIGAHYPHVPVVLMTAHGSDSLALEALECGAASYVPKARLAEQLEPSVARVLALAEADRSYERLVACQTRAEFSFVLDNDAALIDPFVDLVRKLAGAMGLCDSNGAWRIGIALQEAIANALYHGNLELTVEELAAAGAKTNRASANNLIDERLRAAPYRDRKIHVDARITPDQLEVTIADEGPGFDVSQVESLLADKPKDLDGGRGLRLISIMMDEVRFNAVGNEVLLVKRRAPVAAAV